MNIAYSRYLQNALEHSTLTDEEKQGAHAFLKFLSNYKPKGLSLREPDFYGYGDAFGQYGVTRQTLYNRHKELFGELKEQCRRKPRHPIDSTAYRIRDGRTIPAKEKE